MQNCQQRCPKPGLLCLASSYCSKAEKAAVGLLCAPPVQLYWMLRMSTMSLAASAQASKRSSLSIWSAKSGEAQPVRCRTVSG